MQKTVSKKTQGHRLTINWEVNLEHSICIHKYGGNPSNGTVIPACRGCGKLLHLLFQIDLTDPDLDYLRLDDWNYLFILTCLNCASYENPMYYQLDNEGQRITVLQQKPGEYVREYPNPLNEHSVSFRGLRDDEYPLSSNTLSRLLGQEGKHQLGGEPVWVQREEHLACAACSGEMEYIAMVDSELYIGEDGFRARGHMFGDEGILYVFVCHHCGVLATKAQSF